MNKSDQVSPLSVPIPDPNHCFIQSRKDGSTKKAEKEETTTSYEETILRNEMNKLSLSEKENIRKGVVWGNSPTSSTILERWDKLTSCQEYHGLAEGAVFLRLKFAELENHLKSGITNHSGCGGQNAVAYQMAISRNKDYVESPLFKIGFLRTERYDTKKAGQRIIRFFHQKLQLFGPTALTRDVCWEDLGMEGQNYLKRGAFQLLPKRDLSGRRVVFYGDVHGNSMEVTPTMLLGFMRAIFYFVTSLGEHDDEQGRVKGYVFVRWGVHMKALPTWISTFGKDFWVIRECCPYKVSSFHQCAPPLLECLHWMNPLKKIELKSVLDRSKYMQRLKSHYGKELEIKDRLLKEYGIPVDTFPLNDNFEHKTNIDNEPFHTRYVDNWIAERKRIERGKQLQHQHSITTTISPFPVTASVFWNNSTSPQETKTHKHEDLSFGGSGIRKHDVLMGKSASFRSHPGNIRFRKLVEGHHAQYSIYTKKQKSKLFEGIVQKVNQGGRFLKWDALHAVFVEVDFAQAHAKVASAFRDVTKARNKVRVAE